MSFPVEQIPDGDQVFIRFHKSLERNGRPVAGAFKFRGDPDNPSVPASISCDWSRYSTASESRLRAKSPIDNGIAAFDTKAIRQLKDVKLQHEPLADNRSHSGIGPEPTDKGIETQIRNDLAVIAQVVYLPDDPLGQIPSIPEPLAATNTIEEGQDLLEPNKKRMGCNPFAFFRLD